MYDWKTAAVWAICVRSTLCLIRDFSICHDDFENEPADGVLKEHTFNWLGFVQYIHVTTGLPHHSKAPRVILVHRQFVIGTANDMMHLPKNYKLGNIVFGDYERDEEECSLTRAQIKLGIKCPRAYIEIPPLDITPHPEFTRFGVGNSLALVKLIRPMKSNYMIPICLPTLEERNRKKKLRAVYLVDYLSTVPRDFDSERLAKKTLKLFTHRECKRHRMKGKLGSEGVTHVLCSSGCGVRPGAPIINHAIGGPFELMGVAAGGAPCRRRSMRRRLNNEPPLYIDIYPYNNWIMNVITANQIPKPYPQNVMLVEAGPSIGGINESYLRKRKKQRAGWRARTYLTGNFCYKSRAKLRRASFFYSERFIVTADPPAKLNVILKVSAGIECTIVCARLTMPNRLSPPIIEGVGGYNITVKFQTDWFPYSFYFTMGLDGKNTTQRDWNRSSVHPNYFVMSLVCVRSTLCFMRDFSICHDDFENEPADGVLTEHTFNWLGFVQYIHVTNGMPHLSKAPRVILVQKQFVIGTANDVMTLPKNYKLGNIVFGDYERDEEECGLTRAQIKLGIECPRAYIEIPPLDIIPHPEFTRFGVGNSLALVKLIRPMKSNYMIPICLPTLEERTRKKKHRAVYLVDYISTVPRDFDSEKLAKKTLKLFTHRECKQHRMKGKLGSEGVTHVLCSSGCGVRPGAPIINHAIDGPFELMGVAAGGAFCRRHSMRRRLNNEPPLYIDVYPYNNWIMNVITAHHFPKPYPQNVRLVEGGPNIGGINQSYLRKSKKQRAGWRARTYLTGNYCYKTASKLKRKSSFFYTEKFLAKSEPRNKFHFILKISAGIECTIVCARLTMPNRQSPPLIEGVGGYNITVTFETGWFPYSFYFSLGLHGKNTTQRKLDKWIHERPPGFW